MTRYARLISRVWEDGDSFDADPENPDRVEQLNVDCEPDEWSPSAAGRAVEVLRDHGCTEPSSVPGFHVALWYSDPDGSYVVNSRTGARRENSGHLHGFGEEEQREIWQLLTGGGEDW